MKKSKIPDNIVRNLSDHIPDQTQLGQDGTKQHLVSGD